MVLITTINHNFPPDTSSDFLAIVQTDGQMTDRQTDRRPAELYSQAMEPDKFRSLYL